MQRLGAQQSVRVRDQADAANRGRALRLPDMRSARLLLTFVLAAQVISSFALDWSPNHLLSPLWHPHARFHGGLLLFFLAGASATALWLLWRSTLEPRASITAAALIALSFWTPLLYAGLLVPGSTPWAGDPAKVPHLAGFVFYPNQAVAAVFIALTAAGWRLSRRAVTGSSQSHVKPLSGG